MSEELSKAIAAYINYVHMIGTYADNRCITGYLYESNTYSAFKYGHTKCFILGVFTQYGYTDTPADWSWGVVRHLTFNKSILSIRTYLAYV